MIQSLSKPKLIKIAGIIVLCAVIALTYYQARQLTSDTTSDNQSMQAEPNQDEVLSNPISENQNSIVQGLSGIYQGSSRLFAESFVFPESTLELRQDGSFIVSAGGFETSQLNIQEVQLDGQFPFVVIQAFGIMEQNENGVIAQVQGIEVTFTKNVDGITVALSLEETIQITNILESNEILIPSPSLENILIVPMAFDTIPSVTLQSKEESPVYFQFNGYGENQLRHGLTPQNQN